MSRKSIFNTKDVYDTKAIDNEGHVMIMSSLSDDMAEI